MRYLYLSCLLILTHLALGQERETTNTLKLTGTARPRATIKDMAWLAGHWRGNALGGVTEEIWSPPLANSMMGSYRLIKNDTTIVFLELLTLVEQDNSLSIRLKHFNSDLTGWEEKDVVREFKLVKKEEGKLWFQGMTFERIDQSNYKVFLAIKKKNGEVIEEIFAYTKQNELK